MANNSTERTALITGANRGIGFEIARQLARRGFHVVVGARNESRGQQAAEKIRDEGGKATFLSLDVSQSVSIQSAANRFNEITDRLHVLINNAAVYLDQGRSLLTLSRDLLNETLQVNTLGPLELIQAFLPCLRRAAPARIINVSSGYGQLDGLSAYEPSYCLSKLALNGLTIMLADVLGSDRIAVNSMCPGWVRTEMGGPDAPLSVEEGADTAVWLADEAPQQLTGHSFRNRTAIPW